MLSREQLDAIRQRVQKLTIEEQLNSDVAALLIHIAELERLLRARIESSDDINYASMATARAREDD